MRKTIIVLLFSLFCIFADAQSQQVKVVYKNGSSIVGTLVGMDGITSVTISLAGVEITLPMENVETIVPVEVTPSTESQSPNESEVLPSSQYGEYVITDNNEYPDSFVVTFKNQDYTMVLVRGGTFNMGYDDRGSWKMESEPIHKVQLSSFYVSKEYIKDDGDANTSYLAWTWDSAEDIVNALAEQENLPYRLITEAEWEYMAITPISGLVFAETIASKSYKQSKYIGEWCNDIYGEYKKGTQINPQGPPLGKEHVIRTYRPDKYKWSHNSDLSTNYKCYHVRFAIDADKVKFD